MNPVRRLFEITWAGRDVLKLLGVLGLAALTLAGFRHYERSQLPRKAEAAALAQGYEIATFERVVRKGRSYAVACGAADGHNAVYASDDILRVADRDPIANARYRYYCQKPSPVRW